VRTVAYPGRCRLLLPETATVDEWLHARTKGVGGSEVAALFGVSPYATTFDVFKAKTDEAGAPRMLGDEPLGGPRVRPELLTDDPVLEWGHRLEQAVATKAADELGLVARPGGGLWQSIDHPLAIVTPDRVATKNRSMKPVALIECKTSSDFDKWEAGGAPLHYQIQAQWQMGITGVTTCWLACLMLNHDRAFYLVEIEFDEEWFASMVELVEDFWERHVLTGDIPMLDLAHPHTEDLLKDMHPHVVRESVQLPNGAGEWIAAYHQARDVMKTAEARLDECKNWIRAEIGGAAGGYIGDQKVVSYPEIVSHRVSTKLLRELYPEIVEDVIEESTYRRLTVRKPKPAEQRTP
jgi:putative phage-type endonuclease